MEKRKSLTTRQVVDKLRKKGHKIEFKTRKDGGILITSIDGFKYSGASGNKLARDLSGDQLTKAQSKQRTKSPPKE